MAKEDKMQEMINVTLDRELWNGLTRFAHEQSIKQNRRFPVIKALRLSVKIFLLLEPKEINQVLKRNTRNIG